MPSTFGDLLATAIKRAGMNRSAFAKRTGTVVSTVSEVINGQRKPPLARLTAWAAALDLNADQRLELRTAAALAHARPEVRRLIEDQRQEIAHLKSRIAAVERFARRVAEEAHVPYEPDLRGT